MLLSWYKARMLIHKKESQWYFNQRNMIFQGNKIIFLGRNYIYAWLDTFDFWWTRLKVALIVDQITCLFCISTNLFIRDTIAYNLCIHMHAHIATQASSWITQWTEIILLSSLGKYENTLRYFFYKSFQDVIEGKVLKRNSGRRVVIE